MSDVIVDVRDHVVVLKVNRPEHNFFDVELISELADQVESLERSGDCRVVVLASIGKNFCAGANFSGPRTENRRPDSGSGGGTSELYAQGARLFDVSLPIVAAVQGAAVGGGLGLACVADFRVGSSASRFTANFSQLGFHPGFGLSETLPAIIGHQNALRLFYTGDRIDGIEAKELGLVDILAEPGQELAKAVEFAQRIATSAPLALRSIKTTMRTALAGRVRAAMDREGSEQAVLMRTADFKEGIRASAVRETPNFLGA